MDRRSGAATAYDHGISSLFFALIVVLLLTLGLAVLFYAEPFRFWQHAFSDLGSTVSKHGLPNSISMVTYASGMVFEAGIMFRISLQYARSKTLSYAPIKSILALLASGGFLVSVLPNDLYHTLHSIGVGAILAGLYFFTMIFHIELKAEISRPAFIFNLSLLHFAVFSYAVAFFLDTDAKQSLQKICLLGVVFALERVVMLTREGYSPVELLTFLDRFQP
jgi:hypothetical membrane protein